MLSPIEQNELLTETAELMTTVMPDAFRMAELDGIVLAGTSLYRLRVDEGDPEKMRRVSIPYGLDEKLRELRRGMYDPEPGTWYSLHLTLSGDGSFTVEYNYDERPGASILDDEFTRDLGNFPRAEEHIPGWLKEVMAGASNTFGSVHDVPDLPDPHVIAEAFRHAGWSTEVNADTEYTLTTDWARLTTMNTYPIVRFSGRVDLSRIAELEAVLATLAWQSGFETYDDRGQLLTEVAVPRT
ncbi:antitoxin YezG family protein [Pseudonocardia sp. TRM90224]|uniref:antitoxin YezG family protein n=1 Tax=Pseudonocardia sp. TRM90224 TaxID=2812678 RepID=UPI001E3FD0E8|nr:antitoxin YezG family protein [Pseudonocardia sp. TRM90224]